MTDPKCPNCGTALSEHTANRCLDAWAAQYDGWHWALWEGAWARHRSFLTKDALGRRWAGFKLTAPRPDEDRPYYLEGTHPYYSKNISAAMKLVDFESIGKGFHVSILRGAGYESEPQWRCTIENSPAEGETAAEAITKAFISYKESQDAE